MRITIALFAIAMLLVAASFFARSPLSPTSATCPMVSKLPGAQTYHHPRKRAISLVLDRSGSMDQQYLEQARQAAKRIVNKLQDDDSISIVTYGSTARIDLPLLSVASSRLRAEEILNDLLAGGGSNLSLGLEYGQQSLRMFSAQTHERHIVLITDGRANLGLTELGPLQHLVRYGRKHSITLSTLVIGDDVNHSLMSGLTAAGGGSYGQALSFRDTNRLPFFTQLKTAPETALTTPERIVRSM
ncbi:MAG: VWA domain-containing protein [Myxococcales bacterium]|nr:VWA domain-containing protein [Myxococcales bacterium]